MIDGISPFPQLMVSGCIYNAFATSTVSQITHSNTLPHTKGEGITYAIDTDHGESGSPVYRKEKENI